MIISGGWECPGVWWTVMRLAPYYKANANVTSLCGSSQVALVVDNPPANAGDLRDVASIPGLGRCLGEGLATHSSIHAWRIPKDRGAWWATVHRSHSWTWLKWLSMHAHTSLCSIAKMSHVIINCISIKDSTVERNHIKLMYGIFNIYWIEFLFYAKPIDIKRLVRHCYKHSMSIE